MSFVTDATSSRPALVAAARPSAAATARENQQNDDRDKYQKRCYRAHPLIEQPFAETSKRKSPRAPAQLSQFHQGILSRPAGSSFQ
jgi:hypothetical protein